MVLMTMGMQSHKRTTSYSDFSSSKQLWLNIHTSSFLFADFISSHLTSPLLTLPYTHHFTSLHYTTLIPTSFPLYRAPFPMFLTALPHFPSQLLVPCRSIHMVLFFFLFCHVMSCHLMSYHDISWFVQPNLISFTFTCFFSSPLLFPPLFSSSLVWSPLLSFSLSSPLLSSPLSLLLLPRIPWYFQSSRRFSYNSSANSTDPRTTFVREECTSVKGEPTRGMVS